MKGHGVKIFCPISEVIANLAVILFVGDTDVIHLRMDKTETAAEAHVALQANVMSWGNLLIASGGALKLKPPKCFSHILSFRWLGDGTWRYEANEKDTNMAINVPTPSGEVCVIENLLAQEAKETLGVFTAPKGCSAQAVDEMQDKAGDWSSRSLSSTLHRRQLWFMMDKQFWPRVAYGLCANNSSWDTLEECLQNTYFLLLPIYGIVRTIPINMR